MKYHIKYTLLLSLISTLAAPLALAANEKNTGQKATSAELAAETAARIDADTSLKEELAAETAARVNAAHPGTSDGDTLVWNAEYSTWDPTAAISTTSHSIGDLYQGGIIFYVDADGQHGLIAALANQFKDNLSIQWYNGTYRTTGATGDGLYAGAMNTTLIIAMQMNDNEGGSFAAKLAADYSVQADGVTPCPTASHVYNIPNDANCYGDWYLPSTFELGKLLESRTISAEVDSYLGRPTQYWSSTESSDLKAWLVDESVYPYLDQGLKYENHGKRTYARVRSIRKF